METKKLYDMSSAQEMNRLYDETQEGFKYMISVPDNKSIEDELREDFGI